MKIKANWRGLNEVWDLSDYFNYLAAFKPVQYVVHEGYLFENCLN